jgi:hypothetical protein
MVIFTKRKNLEGFLAPKLFDTELILINQVKYLGVILDSKLNWKFYIDNRIRKASIAHWQCCRALYYTAFVWWKKNTSDHCKKQFGRIQRTTCLGYDIYTDGSLFEGRVCSGVFFLRNLILWHLSLLEHSPQSFRLRFTP